MRKIWSQNVAGMPLFTLFVAASVACAPDVGVAPGSAVLGSADSGGDGGLQQCLGATPPSSAWQAKASPEGVAGLTAPVLGSQAPAFALNDFQPQSCGYRATYGPPTFAGRVTVVAILAGW